MARSSKDTSRPDDGAPSAGEADAARGSRQVQQRRDWKRVRRLLPPVLAPWAVVVVICYTLSQSAPEPPLPGLLGWLTGPIESNPFRACRSEIVETLETPAKASFLLIAPANAETALPPEPPPQQAQQQLEQPQDLAAPDLPPAAIIGCGELGFGDLIDVAIDRSGEQIWVLNRHGLVYRSDNGGTSWRRQYLPDLPGGAETPAIAAGAFGDTGIIALQAIDGAVRFYRTENSGETWRIDPELEYPAASRMLDFRPARNIVGLNTGAEGDFVLMLLGDDGAPPVWRRDTKRWAISYTEIEPRMIPGQRTHDFGNEDLALDAGGATTVLQPSWARWQGDTALHYSTMTPDTSDPERPLVPSDQPTLKFDIDGRAIRALAASDEGTELVAVEDLAVLRGNARGEPWPRIDLVPVAQSEDFALRAVAIADGTNTIVAVGRNALFVSHDGGGSFFQPPFGRTPAPWFYLVLLTGPAFAIYLLRPGKPERREVAGDDAKGLSDRALSLKDPDALNLRAYAEGLANLLRHERTRPPLVIGVTGPWGSGKSSVMQMLVELLQQRQIPTVWFNAWHHQSEEHLLAALLSNIRKQGIPSFWTRPGFRLRWRLLKRRLSWRGDGASFIWSWALLLFGLALVSGALSLWAVLAFHLSPTLNAARENGWQGFVGLLHGLVCADDDDACVQMVAAFTAWLPSLKIGAILAFVIGLLPLNKLKQVALSSRSFDPGELMGGMTKGEREAKQDDRLSFRYRFGDELEATVDALAPYRLVIFIDDLDRCRPKNVTAVLEAINFVVSSANCYVVLGMDRGYVLRAIRQEFASFIAAEQAERGAGQLATADEDKGRPRDFAEHYLEKLVNLIVAVPKMSAAARAKLMEQMASAPEAEHAPEVDRWLWAKRSAAAALVLAAVALPAMQFLGSTSNPAQINLSTVAASIDRSAPAAPAQTAGGDYVEVRPSIDEKSARPGAGQAMAGIAKSLSIAVIVVMALVTLVIAALRAIVVPVDLLVRDSKAFRGALKEVEHGLDASLTTPRRAKRFVNRLRMFSAMLRSMAPGGDSTREAELDRATVQAGALHALARELLVQQQADATAPAGAASSRPTQVLYRDAMAQLYRGIEPAGRDLVDALYWQFWYMVDGVAPGDATIAALMTLPDGLKVPSPETLQRLFPAAPAAAPSDEPAAAKPGPELEMALTA